MQKMKPKKWLARQNKKHMTYIESYVRMIEETIFISLLERKITRDLGNYKVYQLRR